MIETTLSVIFILVLVPAWIIYSFSRWAANSTGHAEREIEKQRSQRFEEMKRGVNEHINARSELANHLNCRTSMIPDSWIDDAQKRAQILGHDWALPHTPPEELTDEVFKSMTTLPQIDDPKRDATDVADSDWGKL